MRIRVPVAVRNRLLQLEGVRPQNLPIRGWPPIMDLDEWEVLASRMQDELCSFAQEEIRPNFAPVAVHAPSRKADEGLGEAREQSAIGEYLMAQRKAREQRNALRGTNEGLNP